MVWRLISIGLLFLFMSIFALIPLAKAQVTGGTPALQNTVTCDAGIAFGSTTAVFRDASITGSRPLFRFDAGVKIPGRGGFEYRLLTGQGGEIEFQPQSIFVVGGQEFGSKNPQKNDKPITLEVKHSANHRVIASAPIAVLQQTLWYPILRELPVKPIIVAEAVSANFTCTGEVKGKQTSASENFQKVVAGVGAKYDFSPVDGMRAGCKFAMSDAYQLYCAEILYRFAAWAAAKGNVEYTEIKAEPVKLRWSEFGFGVEVMF